MHDILEIQYEDNFVVNASYTGNRRTCIKNDRRRRFNIAPTPPDFVG